MRLASVADPRIPRSSDLGVRQTSVDLLHPGMENEMFMLEYKEELKREFQQREIFITVSDLQII